MRTRTDIGATPDLGETRQAWHRWGPCASSASTTVPLVRRSDRLVQAPRRCAGTSPTTLVPLPGADSTRRLPPNAPSRSSMLVNPAPMWPVRGSNPGPSSDTANVMDRASSVTFTMHPGVLARVLARVLQRLEHAEVHGGLRVGAGSGPMPSVSTDTGNTARFAADVSASGRPLSASNGG